VRLQPQLGTGLGAALAGAFGAHFGHGFERVVLIGSDNPTLPGTIVEDACRALDDHDLVIGPSTDGGYYLIGMSAPHPGVFEGITWSTDLVYAQTLERAKQLGLRVAPTPVWYDVDTLAELRRLRRELAGLPPDVAPATRSRLTSAAVCGAR
jgi:rSAM/selenodomain-associated transferase 1